MTRLAPRAIHALSHCAVCGQSIATHMACRNCGILIGSGHIDLVAIDGLCSACTERAPCRLKIEPTPRRDPIRVLTDRQLEILALVAEGLTHKEMGRRLDISDQTIKNHLSSIFFRLQARSMAHAVAIALRTGLIK